MNVAKGSWWNRKKVYTKDKELREARTKLESDKTCEAEGNCWRQVQRHVDMNAYMCVYVQNLLERV
jgi:hypothetical protein